MQLHVEVRFHSEEALKRNLRSVFKELDVSDVILTSLENRTE
jgi:hypothetical protein